MGQIHYGDIEYFTLLDLQQRLKARTYDKLDLITLDKLRHEVDVKIGVIHALYHENKKTQAETI